MSRRSYSLNGGVQHEFRKQSLGNGQHASKPSDYDEVANGEVILANSFYIFPKKKVLFSVRITKTSLCCLPTEISELSDAETKTLQQQQQRRQSVSISVPQQINFDDVVGCHVMKGKRSDDTNAYFCVYHYPYKKKRLAKRPSRRRLTTTFAVHRAETFEENMVVAQHWKKVITCLSQGVDVCDLSNCEPPLSKKYLILVNPFSGTRKALSLFKERVVPILSEAETGYDLIITEYSNHARDLITTVNLDKYKGIVIVSGDGLIFEVLNGLMMRSDWEEAIKMPVGTIPGGSGNALSCAINYAAGESLHENWVLHSTFILLKHQVIPMDLVAIDTSKRRLFSFLSISWGIIADVDIESEKFRRLGPVRFTITGLTRILNLRTYRGRLSFLPKGRYIPQRSLSKTGRSASMYEPEREKLEEEFGRPRHITVSATYSGLDEECKMTRSDSTAADDEMQTALEEQLMDMSSPPSKTQVEDINYNEVFTPSHNISGSSIKNSSDGSVIPTPLLPPIDEELPDNWVKIEEDFVMVVAAYQTHLNKNCIVQPDCKFDDGCIHLSFIRKGASRSVLLGLMSALETGSHIDSPYFETVGCSAFRLEPFTPGGIIAVDGEVVDYGTIQAQILPSAARLMARRSENL